MSVPAFPEFRQIDPADCRMLKELFRLDQPVTSELTCAGIILWRHKYGFRVSRLLDWVVIRADEGPFFLPPVGVSDVPTAVCEIFDLSEQEGRAKPEIRRVPEPMALELAEQGFAVEMDRDNSDYVYLARDLIELPGRKYHRKRNHIQQFASKHDYRYARLTRDLVPECIELQETWCDVRDCFTPENVSLAEEHAAVMEALSLLDELGLIGGAIVTDGSVAAFSLGEELNRDTFAIHFEKGNLAYPGIYQVMNQEFCADVAVGYPYVNREQDLGDPGLRKAKESYYPDHLVHKYIVRP
ncbi:MAG: DUF2156 domain-containing protein [Armatimonadetes bacterium]|nr:DUF2156 domain-containing protein [Armatimonadota bacterium]